MMALFHFTSRWHLEMIVATGLILPSESNIGAPEQMRVRPSGAHVGPDVVWLTRLSDALQTGTVGPTAFDKSEARIEVAVDEEARHWPQWARDQGINMRWYDRLGKGRRPTTWYVVERPIGWQEWVEIRSTRDNSVVWTATDGLTPWLSVGDVEDFRRETTATTQEGERRMRRDEPPPSIIEWARRSGRQAP